MDGVIVQELLANVLALKQKTPSKRILVGIAGPPGCGKSTTSGQLVHRLNERLGRSAAEVLSLDGFHLTRDQLQQLPNPDEAFSRRGAPWTFDVVGLLTFVKSLRSDADGSLAQRSILLAPSFDHCIKDPVPEDVVISQDIEILILEHLYLLLDDEVWREVGPLLDYRVMIDVDRATARDRVAKRHVAAGIEPDIESGWRRYDANDALNGELIRARRVSCELLLDSTEG